jgi:hypothetical protein
MLTFSGSLKVFVAVEACDMRKRFNGLHALAAERLGEPLQAHCGWHRMDSSRSNAACQRVNPARKSLARCHNVTFSTNQA